MIEKFWDMAFFFGAIGGVFHSPIIESGKDFFMRMIVYGFTFMVGLCLYFFGGSHCELGNCNAHPVWVGSYIVGSFLMGLGGTGAMVNLAQKDTQYDVDLQGFQYAGMMRQQQAQQHCGPMNGAGPMNGGGPPGGMVNNSFMQPQQPQQQQDYEPVTVPQGPML